MFDRLVCMSGGNPREDLIEHKNPELAAALERSEQWSALSQNHLEGRTAAFFCYGDGGANELDARGRPKNLLHPSYFEPEREPFQDARDAYAPLVWQCRYSGIEVPDTLWRHIQFGHGQAYAENQAEDLRSRPDVARALQDWVDELARHVEMKGKVEPNEFRAYGYEPPGHLLEEAKLAWRDIRMRFGKPVDGSSAAEQQRLGLNRDVTLRPKQGEGEKLRKEK
jgi:hypothetical protein